MKKIIALLLAVILALNLFPVFAHADNDQDAYITELLLAQQTEYPEGDECNNSTEKYHILLHAPGLLLNCQSCWGYCFRLLTSAFNIDPKKSVSLTWQNINGHLSGRPCFEDVYTSPADIRPGDILAWPGHATVVLENKRDQQKLVLAEGNYGGRVHYGREVSYAQVSSRVSYIVRFASSQIPDCNQDDAETQGFQFEDVPKSKYYYHPVQWAVEKKITAGTGPKQFSPDNPCTREQIVTFLWRAAGSPEPCQQTNPFLDVPDRKYFYRAVLWAQEQGITAGVGGFLFGAGQDCTRAQVVTFLWRLAGSPAPESADNPFIDVAEGKYYYTAVLWAVQNGITCGKDSTHFSPDDTCTRAEVVTFIYAAFSQA